jgi:hypothetical protein
LIGAVVEPVGCVGRDVDGFAGSGHEPLAAESELDLAIEDAEHLLKVVAVGRRGPPPGDVHVDQGVLSGRVVAGNHDPGTEMD